MAQQDDNSCQKCCHNDMSRRVVLAGLAGSVALGIATRGALAQDAKSMPPQVGDLLVRASGDNTAPLTPADIEVGAAPIQAWPADPATGAARDGSFFNLLLVTRWDPAEMGPAAQALAAEGVLANTLICPHAACEVTDWNTETRIAQCPCHFSAFDLRNGGALVNGPATRKLPSLGLTLAEGKVAIASGWDSRVGGDAE
jgi:ubiquinol-cytochrome c reductase iron-sulfur subunit/rieske iron-sulfur protein